MNQQISKYRKVHKVVAASNRNETKRLAPTYGRYGLRVLVSTRLTFKQLEAAKKTIRKVVKKNAVIWQGLFADQPVTSKPAEVRMGKGKGAFSHNVAVTCIGTVLFELGGPNLTSKLAREAFQQASHKLGVPTEVVTTRF